MNKTILILVPVLLLAGFFIYRLAADNRELDEQLENLQARMSQQLQQVEESSRQRLQLQNELDELRSQLTESRSRLAAMGSDLETARQQANPEYERMEREIRQQVAREYQQQSRDNDRNPVGNLSRGELINELSSLEPMEMAQLMTIQGRYGAFLQSLNVSNERKEVIIEALNNYLTEQNEARRNVMMQAQVDGFDRRDIRQQMQAIDNPQTRRESLSFALTEEEIQLMEEFEQNQPQTNFAIRTGIVDRQGGDGTGRAVFFGGDAGLPPGVEPGTHIEIITTDDPDQ